MGAIIFGSGSDPIVEGAATDTGTVSVTSAATLVAAANPNRASLTIINEHTSDDIRYGTTNAVKNDADGSSDEGLLIGAGVPYTITKYRGAVYCIAQTGKTVLVSFNEELD